MSSGYEHLVWSLERRYDFLSARIVAAEAVKGAGLEEKAKYSDAELGFIVQQLGAAGNRMEAVWGALGAAPEGVAVQSSNGSHATSAEPAEASTPPKKAPAKKGASKKAPTKKSAAKKSS